MSRAPAIRLTPFGGVILLAAAIGPLFAALSGGESWSSLSLVGSTVVAVTAFWTLYRPESLPAKLILILALSFCVGPHYAATGRIIKHFALQRKDPVIFGIDEKVAGWAFPHGQISLWMDQNASFGPHTTVGKIAIEILQLSYFSYYFWGYLLLIWLVFEFWKARLNGSGEWEWSRLTAFMTAWMGTFLVNFLCYIAVPVVGPQFYLAHQYQHSLEGFGLAGFIQRFILSQQATVEDCFPSGHTSVSWVTAFASLVLAPRYARYTVPAACLITLSTLVLRYHYVTDLLAAIPLILLGLSWGGLVGSRKNPLKTRQVN